ncbi:DUF4142 domain-containing protein [Streptomyces rimosus]|uniref:DUF4142 domain-containing protein n=1 Tax=Streptomyces rimosus TaxID=1927 RepID=UPI0007C4D99A
MRSVTGTGLVVTALAATLAALLFPIWSFAGRPGQDGGADTQTVATSFGPLSALDRDFVNRVRLAGLWELPAGQQAQQRGTVPSVREAGTHLVEGHTSLDRHVREVAAQLGLALPDRPNAQQRHWLAELSAARGAAYDRKFANILRLAHGKVFTVVAQVRATTRNALVRSLADDANRTVLDHISVLEHTGFVDFDAIAEDAAPPPRRRAPRPRRRPWTRRPPHRRPSLRRRRIHCLRPPRHPPPPPGPRNPPGTRRPASTPPREREEVIAHARPPALREPKAPAEPSPFASPTTSATAPQAPAAPTAPAPARHQAPRADRPARRARLGRHLRLRHR